MKAKRINAGHYTVTDQHNVLWNIWNSSIDRNPGWHGVRQDNHDVWFGFFETRRDAIAAIKLAAEGAGSK